MKYLLLFVLFLHLNKANSLIDIETYEMEIEKTPEELVQEIVERFDKIAETTVDFTEKLKLIKDTSASFLKLAVPLGSLLAASLDIIKKPESDEYKALKKMNAHMVYQFDRLNERITYSFEAEEMDTELREFNIFITLQLNILTEKVLYFTDPTKVKNNESIIDLLTFCRGYNGIERMAEYMKMLITHGCSLNNTYVFEKISGIFIDLEERFTITNWNKHEKHLKKRILDSLYSMPTYKAIQILEELENNLYEFSTFKSAIKHIFDMTNHRKLRNPVRCLTDAVINGNLYHRINISFFEALIQIELSRLLIACDLCALFMFPPNPTQLNDFLIKVGNHVSRTSQFASNYIPRKLNMSSGAEKIIITNAIKKFPGIGDIQLNMYKDLALNIYNDLKYIGPKRTEKQVLIYPSESAYKEYNGISLCPEYWCDVVYNHRGVNVLLARFDKKDVFMAKSLMLRKEHLKPEILKILKVKYYVPLPELLKEINTNNITLVDVNWGRTAAIIRHKTVCSVACRYHSVTVIYWRDETELPFANSFSYNNINDRGWFDDNTCYTIYFFL